MTRLTQDYDNPVACVTGDFAASGREHTKIANPLHLYAIDDTDFFIAESAEEALAIMSDTFGITSDLAAGPGSEHDAWDIRQIDDDTPYLVCVEKETLTDEDEDPYTKVTKTAKDWAKENGKGYIFSTEW